MHTLSRQAWPYTLKIPPTPHHTHTQTDTHVPHINAYDTRSPLQHVGVAPVAFTMADVPVCGLVGDDGLPVPARSVHVDVRVVETLSHFTVRASFHTSAAATNAKVRCPLDDTRAAVTGLTLRSASRGEVRSTVKPRAAAGARGRRGRRGRRGGAMPAQRDMFELAVGTLAADEDVELELTYVAELPTANQHVLLTVPAPVTFGRCLAAGAELAPARKVEATPEEVGNNDEADADAGGRKTEEPPHTAVDAAVVATPVPHEDAATSPRASIRVEFRSATRPTAVKCETHADADVVESPIAAGADGLYEQQAGEARAHVGLVTIDWTAGAGLEANFVCDFAMPATWVPAAVAECNEATEGQQASRAVAVPVVPNVTAAAPTAVPATESKVEDKRAATAVGTAPGGDADDAAAAAPGLLGSLMNSIRSRFTRAEEPDFTSQVVFVLDRSGSMSGSKFVAVQQCMTDLLDVLPASAAFDVISFGSRFESMFSQCRRATPDAVHQAVRKITGDMSANMGGTNLADPLRFVYSFLPGGPKAPFASNLGGILKRGSYLKEGIPVTLIVLTDGCVSNRDATIQLVRDNSTRSRCFTFGIGSDVDADLVKGMAFAGHGRCSFVGRSEKLRKQAARRLGRALQRTWYDIMMRWGGEASRDPAGALPAGCRQAPAHIPPMFQGEAELVYLLGSGTEAAATAAGPLPTHMPVHYQCNGQAQVLRTVLVPSTGLPPRTVVQLAARACIKDYEMTGGDAGATAAAVTALSVEHGIASKQATIRMPAATPAPRAPAPRAPGAPAAQAAILAIDCADAFPAAAAEAAVAAPGAPRGVRFAAAAASLHSSSSSDSGDDDDDDDFADGDGEEAYVVSYRMASDSSSGSECEDARTGQTVTRSSAMRTRTWAPRKQRRAPVAWHANGSASDSDGSAGAAPAPTGGRGARARGRRRAASYGSDSSDSDSDDSMCSVTSVTMRAGAGGAGAGGATVARAVAAPAPVTAAAATPAAAVPQAVATTSPKRATDVFSTIDVETVLSLQNADGSFSATPFLAKKLKLSALQYGGKLAALAADTLSVPAGVRGWDAATVLASALVVCIVSRRAATTKLTREQDAALTRCCGFLHHFADDVKAGHLTELVHAIFGRRAASMVGTDSAGNVTLVM